MRLIMPRPSLLLLIRLCFYITNKLPLVAQFEMNLYKYPKFQLN